VFWSPPPGARFARSRHAATSSRTCSLPEVRRPRS